MGLFPGLEFGAGRTSLETGEMLVAYTDGVTDARDGEGRAFSGGRLGGLLAGFAELGLTADEVLGRVVDEVAVHVGEGDAFDDVTLLATRRAP